MGILAEQLVSGPVEDDLFSVPVPPPKRKLENDNKEVKNQTKVSKKAKKTDNKETEVIEGEHTKINEDKIVGVESDDEPNSDDEKIESAGEEIKDERPIDPNKKSRRERKRDEDAKNEKSIFIGNLHVDMTSRRGIKELKNIFVEYGSIESMRFRSMARSDKSSRKMSFIKKDFHPLRDTLNCYIVFKNEESVEKALVENGRVIMGKHIRVDRAIKPTFNYKKSVFIGNIPFDATEEAVYSLFSDCGEGEKDLTSVRIIRDKGTNIGKGFGYVMFESLQAVEDALQKNDCEFLGRKIRITRCKKSLSNKSKTSEIPGANNKNSGSKDSKKVVSKLTAREGEHSKPGDIVSLHKQVNKDKKKFKAASKKHKNAVRR